MKTFSIIFQISLIPGIWQIFDSVKYKSNNRCRRQSCQGLNAWHITSEMSLLMKLLTMSRPGVILYLRFILNKWIVYKIPVFGSLSRLIFTYISESPDLQYTSVCSFTFWPHRDCADSLHKKLFSSDRRQNPRYFGIIMIFMCACQCSFSAVNLLVDKWVIRYSIGLHQDRVHILI